jgi:phosphoglycolate phosphatase-like HAD superfamily hydrolase
MTDFQIAKKMFETLGVEADSAFLRHFVDRYGELLPTSLPRKQGNVMPNVREILEHLRDRRDVRSYLLTGNTRAGARAKLAHYDLTQYFSDGAFAEDTGDRGSIARRALSLAELHGDVDKGRVFVIGDTPHDVECARVIDARTIAVATGGYTFEELEAHDPWCVLRELPSVGEFVKLIDVADGITVSPVGPIVS